MSEVSTHFSISIRNQEPKSSLPTSSSAQVKESPFSFSDSFSRLGDTLSRVTQVVSVATNPRNMEYVGALKKIGEKNPELGKLLIGIGVSHGMSQSFNINDLEIEQTKLIINNLDLIDESGLLNLLREDVSDPQFQSFLKVRDENKELANLLGKLFIKSLSGNISANDISNEELIFIGNNIELLERSGLLEAVADKLPGDVIEMLEFRKNHSTTFNVVLSSVEVCPEIIDYTKTGAQIYTGTKKLYNEISNFVSSSAENIKYVAVHATVSVMDYGKEVVNSAKELTTSAISSAKEVISETTTSIKNAAVEVASNVSSAVVSTAQSVGNVASEVASNVGNAVSSVADAVSDTVSSAASSVCDVVSGTFARLKFW